MPDLPPIVAYDEIDSTNLEARRRVDAGETGPLWITALWQTAGKGRRGRTWRSGSGNLAATLLMSTRKPPLEAAQVAFVAALAVADLAATYAPASKVSLKWPNDTLLAGRKLSGILVESGPSLAGLWLAVGIGVNLAEAPNDVERPATALADYMDGPPPGPSEALEILSKAFERWRDLWEIAGFAPIAEAWTERAHGLGQACSARLPGETVDGVAEGLDLDGALRLRLADGTMRRITAGDVFF
ncbi:MAG TPA: biotin--[acetyl-CoA-carboxylase] ligase [Caulobacteraceae bacterium]|jgi:BirA family biotin operon repressor/biotin-[acetyl-CoA-carboxylase] ligase|nr:biotin--[acetyl-CoA-carboxylase] ligase [Caulobacteraceae bacterium]